MGAAPEVQETVYRYSVLGRQGVPAELKGAFLVSCRLVGTRFPGLYRRNRDLKECSQLTRTGYRTFF